MYVSVPVLFALIIVILFIVYFCVRPLQVLTQQILSGFFGKPIRRFPAEEPGNLRLTKER